jgi:hypothetical protein
MPSMLTAIDEGAVDVAFQQADAFVDRVVRRPDGNFRERRPLMARMKNGLYDAYMDGAAVLAITGSLFTICKAPAFNRAFRRRR